MRRLGFRRRPESPGRHVRRTTTLKALETSIRIYASKLLRQWWGSIGLLFGVLGLVLKFTGWVQPPASFWVAAALLTVLIASFQLFHSDRINAAEQAIEWAGPAIPHWDGIGIRGHRGGDTYLEVMACSQDPSRPAISTTDFLGLRNELIAPLGVHERDLETRSFSNFFEVTVPGPSGFERLAKVDASGSELFIKLSWRLREMPVDFAEVLVRSADGLRALRSGSCARALGKRPWLLISVADWPSGGIEIGGLITAQSWADTDHRGQAVYLQTWLRPGEADWSFVLQFAGKLLGDAGYIGYEGSLASLVEDDARAGFATTGRAGHATASQTSLPANAGSDHLTG